jgi:hypothetical protein
LVLAGVAALATYHFIGSSSPFDALKLGRLHRHVDALAAHLDSAQAKSGNDATKRGDGEFDEIDLENTAGATITIGDTASVDVLPSDGSGRRIVKSVHNGKLVISGTGSGARLMVTLPHLKTLRVDGPGDVDLVGLRDPLSITANGPSTLRATGAVDHLNLTLNGPSTLGMTKLQAKAIDIRMNGGGDAELFATQSLQAEVHGMGRVRYLGDPKTVTKITGSGSIAPLPPAEQS